MSQNKKVDLVLEVDAAMLGRWSRLCAEFHLDLNEELVKIFNEELPFLVLEQQLSHYLLKDIPEKELQAIMRRIWGGPLPNDPDAERLGARAHLKDAADSLSPK